MKQQTNFQLHLQEITISVLNPVTNELMTIIWQVNDSFVAMIINIQVITDSR